MEDKLKGKKVRIKDQKARIETQNTKHRKISYE